MAERCPTCGQPRDLEQRVQAWAAETRAFAAQMDAERAARVAPYRTARYRRWRWPVVLTSLGLGVGALYVTPGLGWVVVAWTCCAVAWVMNGREGE